VFVDEIEKFRCHGGRFFSAPFAKSSRRAVLEMILHQTTADSPERFLHGGDLDQDIGTVTIFLNHPLQPAHLTLNPAKPA
jgi:hypothetical protein